YRHDLNAAYEATQYWIDEVAMPFYVYCGQRCTRIDGLLDAHGVTEWAFVTAANPGSRRLSDEENARRNEALRERLRGRAVKLDAGRGVGTVGDWPAEPSFLALGLGEAEARAVAAEFGQNAILAGRRGEAARLVWV